ncbi:hypothetical protein Tco_1250834 [Tanacetum coccineum]
MPDENQVLLKVPRQHNMYTFDMKNVNSSKGYTCLLAKASSADDIMTFRKELDALALKHLGPVLATARTSTNPVNTGSDNLNTGFEEVTSGNIEAMLPNADLFEGMGQIGYPTDGTFTFWKSFFTPQWHFLVHHLLHCISSKSGGWDQFGSNIATALICLSSGRVYNFSKLIFDGMVANLKSKTKFLMYPRFLQMILNIQTENKTLYLAVSLTKKIFGNMKRGFRGAPRPLLPSMLLVATNPNAGQEHAAVAQSQPSSSTPQAPTPPPIPTPTPPPIPTPTPPPIPTPTSPPPPPPETEPTTDEHIYEEQSPVHHHFSPSQEQAPSHMPMDDLLQAVPKLISRIDSLEMDLKQTKLTMGNAIVKLVKKVKKLEGFMKRRNLVSRIDKPCNMLVLKLVNLFSDGTGYYCCGNKLVLLNGDNTGSMNLVLFLAEAIRLDSLLKEEEAKQIHLDSLLAQRIVEEEELTEQQKKRKSQFSFEVSIYYERLGFIRANRLKLCRGNQGTWKLSQLKKLSFEEVKEEFDKLVKQVESFAPINFEATKAGLKRFSEELQTKTPKRLKDDEAKDDEPTKNAMLKSISRDDLTELYRIVMNRYGMDGPEDKLEKGFWNCLELFQWMLYMLAERKISLSAENGENDEKQAGIRKCEVCKVRRPRIVMSRINSGGGAMPLTQQIGYQLPCLTNIREWLVQEQTALG